MKYQATVVLFEYLYSCVKNCDRVCRADFHDRGRAFLFAALEGCNGKSLPRLEGAKERRRNDCAAAGEHELILRIINYIMVINGLFIRVL